MTKILKSPARINRRSQYSQTSGYSWDNGKVIWDDPFETLEKKERRREADRARDNKNKRRGL